MIASMLAGLQCLILRVHASGPSFCTLKTEQREEEKQGNREAKSENKNCGTFDLKGKTITISNKPDMNACIIREQLFGKTKK